MRRQSLVVIGLVICVFASSYISYIVGYSRNMSARTSVTSARKDLLFKDDYPLLEVKLNKKYKWTLVIREHLRTKDETFRIITQVETMEFNREHISVLTFPVGRGTTPDGCLYLYKGHILIKEVPFVNIQISNRSLERDIQSVSYDKVREIIAGELPPLF